MVLSRQVFVLLHLAQVWQHVALAITHDGFKTHKERFEVSDGLFSKLLDSHLGAVTCVLHVVWVEESSQQIHELALAELLIHADDHATEIDEQPTVLFKEGFVTAAKRYDVA